MLLRLRLLLHLLAPVLELLHLHLVRQSHLSGVSLQYSRSRCLAPVVEAARHAT
jgi:hypothetical protein